MNWFESILLNWLELWIMQLCLLCLLYVCVCAYVCVCMLFVNCNVCNAWCHITAAVTSFSFRFTSLVCWSYSSLGWDSRKPSFAVCGAVPDLRIVGALNNTNMSTGCGPYSLSLSLFGYALVQVDSDAEKMSRRTRQKVHFVTCDP